MDGINLALSPFSFSWIPVVHAPVKMEDCCLDQIPWPVIDWWLSLRNDNYNHNGKFSFHSHPMPCSVSWCVGNNSVYWEGLSRSGWHSSSCQGNWSHDGAFIRQGPTDKVAKYVSIGPTSVATYGMDNPWSLCNCDFGISSCKVQITLQDTTFVRKAFLDCMSTLLHNRMVDPWIYGVRRESKNYVLSKFVHIFSILWSDSPVKCQKATYYGVEETKESFCCSKRVLWS